MEAGRRARTQLMNSILDMVGVLAFTDADAAHLVADECVKPLVLVVDLGNAPRASKTGKTSVYAGGGGFKGLDPVEGYPEGLKVNMTITGPVTKATLTDALAAISGDSVAPDDDAGVTLADVTAGLVDTENLSDATIARLLAEAKAQA